MKRLLGSVLVSLALSFVAVNSALAVVVFPSTNDANRTNGWAHVDEISKDVGEVTLDFISERTFWSCFEYRTDGDTSQMTSPNNFNTNVTDGLYPHYCQNNSSRTATFSANEYVEVRLAFGAESDERFDWTRFDVIQPIETPIVNGFLSPDLACGSFANIHSTTVDWTDSTGGSGVVGYEYFINYPLLGGGYGNWSTFVTNSQRSGVLNEGTHTVKVRAKDSSGSYSDWSNLCTLTTDWTDPSQVDGLTIYKGHNSLSANELSCGGYTNDPKIRIAWNPSDDLNIDHYWFGTKFNSTHKKVVHPKTYYDGNMTPGNNPYFYTVIAVDKAGNESVISEQCAVILDTVAPVVQVTSHTEGRIVKGTQTITGKVEDENLSHYWFVIHNSLGQKVAGPGTVSNMGPIVEPSFSWNTTLVPDGTYTIKLEARDLADNKDSGSVHWVKVVVDNTSPVVDLQTPEDGDILSGTIQLEGLITEDHPSHYNISLYKDLDGTCDISYTWNFANRIWQETVNNNNVVNHSLDTTAFDSGKYMIRLAARDTVGNRDPMSNSGVGDSVQVICVTIDNEAPEAEVLSSITKYESDITGRLIKLTDNIELSKVCYDLGSGEICTSIGGTSFDWNVSSIINSLGVGDHTFSYWVFDTAGNRSDSDLILAGDDDHSFDITVEEDPIIVPLASVLGASTGSTPPNNPPTSPILYSYNTGVLGIGGPDEEQTTEEEEQETEEETEVKGVESEEDTTTPTEDNDTQDEKSSWIKYLWLLIPVFIILFFILKRRKEEEEQRY